MKDKEKIILSVAGSLAVLVVGYLIWRHEQTIQAQNNASQDAANEAAEEQYVQQLEESTAGEYSSGDSLVYGNGASGEQFDDGGSAITQTGDSDSNLAAILAAFGYTGNNSSNGNSGSTTPTNPTSPVTGQPVGDGGGVSSPISTPIPVPVRPQPVGPAPVIGGAAGATLPVSSSPVATGGPSKRFTGTAM